MIFIAVFMKLKKGLPFLAVWLLYRIYPTCMGLQPMDLTQDRHSLSWAKLSDTPGVPMVLFLPTLLTRTSGLPNFRRNAYIPFRNPLGPA